MNWNQKKGGGARRVSMVKVWEHTNRKPNETKDPGFQTGREAVFIEENCRIKSLLRSCSHGFLTGLKNKVFNDLSFDWFFIFLN